MEKTSTLNVSQLKAFHQEEKDFFEATRQEETLPKKSTVEALLNFSKSLSIRKSKTLEHFEIVLS